MLKAKMKSGLIASLTAVTFMALTPVATFAAQNAGTSNTTTQSAKLLRSKLGSDDSVTNQATGPELGDITPTYTAEAQRRVTIMSKVGSCLKLTGNELSVTVPDSVLKSEYGLADNDITMLKEVVTGFNTRVQQTTPNVGSIPEVGTFAYIKGGNLYLSFMEVEGIVGNLAILGPAAIMGALSAAMSVVPGAGTIIGLVVGFFGAAPVASALMNAAAHKEGVKIGISGISAVKYHKGNE